MTTAHQTIAEQMQESLNRHDQTSEYLITDVCDFPDNHYEFICRCLRTHIVYVVHAQYAENTLIIHSVYEF